MGKKQKEQLILNYEIKDVVTYAHQTVRYERKCSESKHPRAEQLIGGEMSAFEKWSHWWIIHSTYECKLKK